MGLFEHPQQLAGARGLDRLPIERHQLIPRRHDVNHADVFVAAVVRGLQELHRPLALDVIGGDETDQPLFLCDQQRAHAQPDHVAQRIVDLPFGIDGHGIVPLEIGDRIDRGITRLQRLPVEDGASRELRIPEFSHRQQADRVELFALHEPYERSNGG